MKMFGNKSVSTFLFFVSRIFTIAIGLLLVFILMSLATGNFELLDNRFEIKIPLSEMSIKGFYESNIITTISITLFCYTLFFYGLSEIFKVFKSENIFTKIVVRRLKYFALFNLIGPPLVFILIHYFIMQHSNFRTVPTYLLHVILGTFVLFIATIFQKGFQVQQENDLTI